MNLPPAYLNQSLISRRVIEVLAVFLGTYFTLQIYSFSRQSATYDEPLHLTSGYMALKHGDQRVDPTHPPFLRMWAALPLLASSRISSDSTAIDQSPSRTWPPKSLQYSQNFLFFNNDADQLLNPSRLMIVMLGALLGVLIFLWALEWLGFLPASFALLFFLIEPNLAAHFTLVTTDGGVTLFYFGTAYFLWRTCREFTVFNVSGLTVFFALAIVSKFSAVILGPLVLLLMAVALSAPSALTFRRAVAIFAILVVATFVVVWIVYGFRYTPSANANWIYRAQDIVAVNAHYSLINALLNWADAHHLLPNAYTQGFVIGFGTASPMPGYLGGEINTDGWWYYFPLALLIKTQTGLLGLIAVGAFFLMLRRRQLGTATVCFVFFPAALFFAVAMTSSINIGLRHVLPIYPFLILIATVGFRELLILPGRVKWAVLIFLIGGWIVMFARAYPNTLAFFNRFVGDSRGGWSYLSDSNLDWGQHLKLVKTWMDKHDVKHVNLAYFGMSRPAYYGIDHTAMPGNWLNTPHEPQPVIPGYVAIGATTLSGVYLPQVWRDYYRGFAEEKPVVILGNAVAIYYVETWPGVEPSPDGKLPALTPDRLLALAEALYASCHWPSPSIPYFQQYLKLRPKDWRAALHLGSALLTENRNPEALSAFQIVTAQNPDDGSLYRQMAGQLLNNRELPEALHYAQESVRLLPTSLRSKILLEMVQDAIAHPEREAATTSEAHDGHTPTTDPEENDLLRPRR